MDKSGATTKKETLALTPLFDRVFVQRDEAEETYGGVIIIPDTAKDKMQTGVVVAAGPGKVSELTNEFRPMSVKEGDKVVFGQFTGDPIKIRGKELLMMREDQIYATIDI